MQNSNLFSWKRFNEAPIVGVIRGLKKETIWQITPLYAKAGFSTLEITMNTPNATHLISDLRKEFPALNVGAGTVCTLGDFDLAVGAGAQFIVTPIINEEVIEESVAQNIPIFPGAFSPSEIYRAWTLGASAVKIFPASQLGPHFLKDILAPFDGIKLLPTGGVSLENINSFFKAGAFGVGMGSSLFDMELIRSNDYENLWSHFAAVRAEITEFLKD